MLKKKKLTLKYISASFQIKYSFSNIVFVDLFKMAHNVTGGFNPKEREFIGLWARKTNVYNQQEGFDINEL